MASPRHCFASPDNSTRESMGDFPCDDGTAIQWPDRYSLLCRIGSHTALARGSSDDCILFAGVAAWEPFEEPLCFVESVGCLTTGMLPSSYVWDGVMCTIRCLLMYFSIRFVWPPYNMDMSFPPSLDMATSFTDAFVSHSPGLSFVFE